MSCQITQCIIADRWCNRLMRYFIVDYVP